jgi:hypothetical protein
MHSAAQPDDAGLRASTLALVHLRMPSILADAAAWDVYVRNKELLRAYHLALCEGQLDAGARTGAGGGMVGERTPPATPTSAVVGGEKRKRVRTTA